MSSVPDYKIVGQRNSTVIHLSGLPVLVEELKLRHLFDLLELVEKTSMPVNLSPDQGIEVFSASLVAALTFSVADDEAGLLNLLRDILRPQQLIKYPKTSTDRSYNEHLWTALYEELEDPEVSDLIDMVTVVVNQSAETIISLGQLDVIPEDDDSDDDAEEGLKPSFTPDVVPDFAGRDLLGGFSRAFDLFSSEYGWTDDVIQDLCISRFRQIFCAIKERKWNAEINKKEAMGWQIRTVAEFIAATTPWSEGEDGKFTNSLVEAARMTGLNKRQRKQVRESDQEAPSDQDVYIDPETGERTYLKGNNNFMDIAMFQKGMKQGTHAM